MNIIMFYAIWGFFLNVMRKSQFFLVNAQKIMSTLYLFAKRDVKDISFILFPFLKKYAY